MSQEVDILINGRVARKYGHQGRTYIEARDGSEYTIRIRNNNSGRVEGVTTVDGLDVITGKLGSKFNRGYVHAGYNSDEIKGFRTSKNEVRAFKFAAKGESYAANSEATGYSDQNCGVIGVTFYSEKVKPAPVKVIREKEYVHVPYYVPRRPYWTETYPYYGGTYCNTTGTGDTSNDTHKMTMDSFSRSAEPKGVQKLSMNQTADVSINFVQSSVRGFSADLGTEFSDTSIQDRVTDTAFDRGHELPRVEIYYASRQVLEAMGIDLEKGTQIASDFPSSFPKENSGYCQPPRR